MDAVNFVLLVINFLMLVVFAVRNDKAYVLNAVSVVILCGALASSMVINELTAHIDSKFEQMEKSE